MLDYFYSLDMLLSYESQSKFEYLVQVQLIRQKLCNEENQ